MNDSLASRVNAIDPYEILRRSPQQCAIVNILEPRVQSEIRQTETGRSIDVIYA